MFFRIVKRHCRDRLAAFKVPTERAPFACTASICRKPPRPFWTFCKLIRICPFSQGNNELPRRVYWVRKQEDNSPARPHKHLEYFWSLRPMLKPPLSITKTGRWPLELHSKLEGLQPLNCPIIRPCKWELNAVLFQLKHARYQPFPKISN